MLVQILMKGSFVLLLVVLLYLAFQLVWGWLFLVLQLVQDRLQLYNLVDAFHFLQIPGGSLKSW